MNNVFEDIFKLMDKILSELDISEGEKNELKGLVTIGLYSNILQKIISKANGDELNDIFLAYFSKLPIEEKSKFSEELLVSSGDIMAKIIKPCIDVSPPESQQKIEALLVSDLNSLKK